MTECSFIVVLDSKFGYSWVLIAVLSPSYFSSFLWICLSFDLNRCVQNATSFVYLSRLQRLIVGGNKLVFFEWVWYILIASWRRDEFSLPLICVHSSTFNLLIFYSLLLPLPPCLLFVAHDFRYLLVFYGPYTASKISRVSFRKHGTNLPKFRIKLQRRS